MAGPSQIEVAERLVTWLELRSSESEAVRVGAAIGYRIPWVRPRAARVRLLSELVIAYSALVIYAVNRAVATDSAKAIIDPFLEGARPNVFSPMEQRAPDFAALYTQRVSDYFKLVQHPRPEEEIARALLSHLGVHSPSAESYLRVRFSTDLDKLRSIVDPVGDSGQRHPVGPTTGLGESTPAEESPGLDLWPTIERLARQQAADAARGEHKPLSADLTTDDTNLPGKPDGSIEPAGRTLDRVRESPNVAIRGNGPAALLGKALLDISLAGLLFLVSAMIAGIVSLQNPDCVTCGATVGVTFWWGSVLSLQPVIWVTGLSPLARLVVWSAAVALGAISYLSLELLATTLFFSGSPNVGLPLGFAANSAFDLVALAASVAGVIYARRRTR